MDTSPAYVKVSYGIFSWRQDSLRQVPRHGPPGEALDQVRRELQREGADLKGTMWSLHGNTWNLSEDRQEQAKRMARGLRTSSTPEPLPITELVSSIWLSQL